MKPVFIYTQNVKDFLATMEAVKKRIGNDSLAMIFGRAGRGKTRTAKWYATQNDCVYLTSLRGWSELWLYQDILTAMGIQSESQPRRKKPSFEMICRLIEENPRPVILDEADLLGERLLETIRDLCKVMMVPFVLVGEESLPVLMNKDRRVWSRCCATMEFRPMDTPDVIAFCKQATNDGLLITTETADLLQRAAGGDIRLIELAISQAETIARANHAKDITLEMAQAAIKKVLPERRK